MDEQDRRRNDKLAEFRRKLENKRKYAPKTLTEAVERLLSELSDDDKKLIAEMPEEDLDQFHMTWGTGIRNSWLWGNKKLLESCGTLLPDSASSAIVSAVWMALNRKGERT